MTKQEWLLTVLSISAFGWVAMFCTEGFMLCIATACALFPLTVPPWLPYAFMWQDEEIW